MHYKMNLTSKMIVYHVRALDKAMERNFNKEVSLKDVAALAETGSHNTPMIICQR